jgi:hypothetical protein
MRPARPVGNEYFPSRIFISHNIFPGQCGIILLWSPRPITIFNVGVFMNSKVGLLVLAIMAATVLFLIGGFAFGKSVGIICVLLAIFIGGLAGGNLMNSSPDNQQQR